MAKPNGAVIFEGPSKLDGAPIVVVVTGIASKSDNPKTGAMLQTWILRADMHPSEALESGADASICGTCPHRPRIDERGKRVRTCYVNPMGPASVWRTYKRGGYPSVQLLADIASMAAGRPVRLGSYGDPAAVPTEVWEALIASASGHTGYTHQLEHPSFDAALLQLCMVSADSEAQLRHAESIGARAFYVRPVGTTLPARVVQCPASEEAGKRATCAKCMLCGGASVKARSISIMAHGGSAAKVRE